MLTENILLKVKLPRYFQGLSHPSYNENEIYSKKKIADYWVIFHERTLIKNIQILKGYWSGFIYEF